MENNGVTSLQTLSERMEALKTSADNAPKLEDIVSALLQGQLIPVHSGENYGMDVKAGETLYLAMYKASIDPAIHVIKKDLFGELVDNGVVFVPVDKALEEMNFFVKNLPTMIEKTNTFVDQLYTVMIKNFGQDALIASDAEIMQVREQAIQAKNLAESMTAPVGM